MTIDEASLTERLRSALTASSSIEDATVATLCASAHLLCELHLATDQQTLVQRLKDAGLSKLGTRQRALLAIASVATEWEANRATAAAAAAASPPEPALNASELREAGKRHFEAGRFDEARRAYTETLAALASGVGEASAARREERATVLVNRAAVALKLSDLATTINDCTAALALDPPEATRAKALYRRAAAFAANGDPRSANADLAELMPSSDARVRQLAEQVDARLRLMEHADVVPTGSSAAAASPSPSPSPSPPSPPQRRVERPSVGAAAGGAAAAGGGAAAAAGGGAAAGGVVRVSCIAPTTPERHLFHEQALYRCFAAQTHPHVELVVVDSGGAPSPFFTRAGGVAEGDPRVKYVHVPQRQQQQQTQLSIGEKRNLAVQHATGDVICHFDDDDLYAPSYVSTMLAAMTKADADFVKLSSWLVHDLQTGATGRFDADAPFGHEALRPMREQFLYTYGFSFMYRRALFPTFSFASTSWGEDQDILRRVREAGRRVALHRDEAGICLHNQHGENCSRSFAQATLRLDELRTTPLAPLLGALPLIARELAGRRGLEEDDGAYEMPRAGSGGAGGGGGGGGGGGAGSGGGGGGGGGAGAGGVRGGGGRGGGSVVVTSATSGGLFRWDAEVARHGGDAAATLDAFTKWLWSGNGFSKERYAKLGLERPRPPQSVLAQAAAVRQGAGQGLEALRAAERVGEELHQPGAITNPAHHAHARPVRGSSVR